MFDKKILFNMGGLKRKVLIKLYMKGADAILTFSPTQLDALAKYRH